MRVRPDCTGLRNAVVVPGSAGVRRVPLVGQPAEHCRPSWAAAPVISDEAHTERADGGASHPEPPLKQPSEANETFRRLHRVLHCCSLAAPPRGAALEPEVRQLVVGIAPDWNSMHGRLQCFERPPGGAWKPSHRPSSRSCSAKMGLPGVAGSKAPPSLAPTRRNATAGHRRGCSTSARCTPTTRRSPPGRTTRFIR